MHTGCEELGPGTRPRIVVGVDGSEESKSALRWAAATAGRSDALIDAVIVWHEPVVYAWPDGVGLLSDWDPAADAAKAVSAAVDETFGPDRPAGLRTFVLEGDPAQRLIEHAAGATQLIVGNRGVGGFVGLLLGSVSSKCAAHAACPVLIVHREDVPPPVVSETRPS